MKGETMRETTDQTKLRMLIDGKLEQHAALGAEADAVVAALAEAKGPDQPALVERLAAMRNEQAALCEVVGLLSGRLDALRIGQAKAQLAEADGENEAAMREATEARVALTKALEALRRYVNRPGRGSQSEEDLQTWHEHESAVLKARTKSLQAERRRIEAARARDKAQADLDLEELMAADRHTQREGVTWPAKQST